MAGPGQGRAEGARQRTGRPAKSAAAFRTISEVAGELDVAQHVLRFWESKFPQVRPLKRGGGRRYYRPEDVELLRRIRSLLYEQGYTIKGAQKLLREQRRGGVENAADAPGTAAPAPAVRSTAPSADPAGVDLPPLLRHRLEELRAELVNLRRLLKDAGI